ncbi:hypothetical protein [Streptomyces phaeoluteigriseus]|nr:hypothetical protein [Streptomyces phaeoluteigriseus]
MLRRRALSRLSPLAENSGKVADRDTANGADVRQWTRLTDTRR